ncbi:hypothetical protein MHI18_02645 [Peribacillus sp. FSL H8-0477]|uniref:hypothetical protein n=1 Tax=Peribacillus sp. FSL H8-0477 TaxID=2921388 RepID=UPI0030FAE081
MDSASGLLLIPILLYLFIIGFSIYFVIMMILFMNRKTKLDKERNQKLDELIQVIRNDKGSV